MSRKAPELVFVDPRVARTMDQDGGEGLVGYVRQDLHEKAVRGSRGGEMLVQLLTAPGGNLVGLTNWGRIWTLLQEDQGEAPAWKLIQDGVPKTELDS